MKQIVVMLVLLWSLGSVLALESNEGITVMQGLQEDENFSTLRSLLESSGLSEQLLDTGGFTLFAPTNEAFDALGAERMNLLGGDSVALAEVLQLHIVSGVYSVLDLNKAEEGSITNSSDETYSVAVTASGLTINGVNLVSTDVDNLYSDGVIHAVSEVILPTSLIGGDTNGDGIIDNNDIAETIVLADTNGDGIMDANDIPDSNNDGVTDQRDYIAAGLTDSNKDGVVDAFDLTTPGSGVTDVDPTEMSSITDTNKDGMIDSNDVTDMNDDGMVDAEDLLLLGVIDMNGDGLVDSADMSDTNDDGMIDALDMNVTTPMVENNTGADITVIMDSDTDGQNNCEDENDGIDSDGDGADLDQCRES